MRRIIKTVIFSLAVALSVCAPRATHFRHRTGWVGWVEFAPDGRRCASESRDDRAVRIWDGVTRDELAVLPLDEDQSRCGAFSPDGRLLALGGTCGVVTVWNADTGAAVCRFAGPPGDYRNVCGVEGHTGDVTAVAFRPDGKAVASGNQHGLVTVWDLTATAEVLAIRTRHEYLSALAFSPDGKLLASGGSPGRGQEIRLWEAATGKELRTLTEARGYVTRLLFSPDGGTLCSVASGEFKLWDVATGRPRACEQPRWLIDEDEADIDALAFSPDGRTLAAGHQAAIGLWDVDSGRNTSRFPPDDAHHLLRFSDRYVLWPDLPGYDPHIAAAAFRPNGDLMVIGTARSSVVMWRLTSVPLAE
jgi:WD40 repeat protein